MDPYNPEWLTAGFLEDIFPWSEAVQTTMGRFLSLYTLHDSYWIGLKTNVRYSEAVAAIRFDAFWTEGRVPHPGPEVALWPVLLLRFLGVAEVSLTPCQAEDDYQGAILGAETGEDDYGSLTSIDDDIGGRCAIRHRGPIDVLIMSRSGQPYPLEDLRT